MAQGARHYGDIRDAGRDRLAAPWWRSTPDRVDDLPRHLLRRHAATAADRPYVGDAATRLVFMDEPTGGLDVSVQARLLDLIRGLGGPAWASAVVLVTHDIAVARLLAGRIAGDAARGGWWKPASPTRCWTIRSIPTPNCSSARLLHGMSAGEAMLAHDGVSRRVLHPASARRDVRIPVLDNVSLDGGAPASAWCCPGRRAPASPLSCAAVYGNYRVRKPAACMVRHHGTLAGPGTARSRALVLAARRDSAGLCQPVPARGAAGRHALHIVEEALAVRGTDPAQARERARAMLLSLNIPERLHGAAARDVLRRGTAAGQPGARLRWAAIRFCCWTSRPPRWTRPTATSSSTWCGRRRRGAWPSSASSTMRRCATRSPTGCIPSHRCRPPHDPPHQRPPGTAR